MIKCENGNINVCGDSITIVADLIHVILRLKENINVTEFHKMLNSELLKCVQANNSDEFMKIDNINEIKILTIVKESKNVKL